MTKQQAATWKLVPVDPTPEMHSAYNRAIHNYIESLPDDAKAAAKGRPHGYRVKAKIKFRARYAAMLAAAPASPGQGWGEIPELTVDELYAATEGLPYELVKWLATIKAHAHVICNPDADTDIRGIAACISQNCADAARAARASLTSRDDVLEEAAKELERLAIEQDKTNKQNPDHAKAYPSWVDRVFTLRLSASAIRALKSPADSEKHETP